MMFWQMSNMDSNNKQPEKQEYKVFRIYALLMLALSSNIHSHPLPLLPRKFIMIILQKPSCWAPTPDPGDNFE